MKDLKVLGTISRSHGLKGAFKLNILVEECPQLEKEEPVFIQLQGGPVPFFVEEFSIQSNTTALLKVDDVDTIEGSEKLVGKEVWLPIDRFSEFDQLGKADDMVGFEVHDINHGYLGKISAIMHMQQHPILEVRKEEVEILIPYVEEIVKEVDAKQRKVVVETPDGLIGIYTNG